MGFEPCGRAGRAAARASLLFTVLIAGGFCRAPDVFAQGSPSLSSLRVSVLTTRGQSRWGTANITRGIEREFGAAFDDLVPEGEIFAAAGRLGIAKRNRHTIENIAKAGAAAGVQYVLRTTVTKQGWLYTARALLVNCTTGQVDMDFRSAYYKPRDETLDRGQRIGRKAVQKLGILLKAGALVAAAPKPPTEAPMKPPVEAPAELPVEAPPPDPTPTASDPTAVETVPDQTTPTETATGDEPPGEPAESEPTSDDALAMADASGDEDFDFNAEFNEDAGVDTEFDGFTSEGGWNWDIRGYVGTSVQGFLHSDIPDHVDGSIVKLSLKTTLTGHLGDGARLRILPFVEADLQNQRLYRLVVEEGFFEKSFETVEFRIGWDALTWGSASTVNIVDIINARDFTEGVTNAPKMGQPMAAVRLLFGNHILTLLYMTPFVEPKLPRVDSPFYAGPTPDGPIDADGHPMDQKTLYASKLDEWHPQAAARLALAFSGLDLRANYFYGYGRYPLVHLASQTLVYSLVHHASVETQVLLGQTSIKAEVASVWHQNSDRLKNPPITLKTRDGTAPAASILIPDQRFTWVAGIEHTFDDWLWGSTLIPVAEFIGDSDSKWFTDDTPPDDITRFFDNHLLYGFRWDLKNDVDSRLEFSDIVDLRNPGDHLLTIKYTERWFGHFTFSLGGRLGLAEDGHKMTAFRRLTGVFTELRLNY